MRHLCFFLLVLTTVACSHKLKPMSEQSLIVEIRPELQRSSEGDISLRVITNLPDGTQLKAFSTELPGLRECSVVRDHCDFSAWTSESVTQNFASIEVSIQADFGIEQQSAPVYDTVGHLGSNLRGPLVTISRVQTEAALLSFKARVPIEGS